MKRKLIVSLGIALVVGCSFQSYQLKAQSKSVTIQDKVVSQAVKVESIETRIHFIDTGQSDCILIEDSGEFMLIDGGDRDDDKTVINYLNSVGVSKLKFLIASHFDADHLGGLDSVAKTFGVESVYVPNGSADTQVYRDFIQACIDKVVQPSVPLPDAKFTLGNSSFVFRNTKGGYGDRNNDSLVVELVSGKTKTLFMGDAEKEAEAKILGDLGDCDILKVGHHGSHSSSTPAFLDKVKPEVAVIQVGAGNKYGHPHQETMTQLKDRGVEVHRSDECGTVIYDITSEGYSTSCKVKGSYEVGGESSEKPQNKPGATSEKVQPKPDTSTASDRYFWTPSGKSYHKSKSCSTLSRSKTILEGTLAESGKSDPCDKCN